MAYEAEREALLFDFFFLFLTGARCSNQAENYYMWGRAFFLLSKNFGFVCSVFAVPAVPCYASSFVHTASISKEEKEYPTVVPGVCTYVRHVSERSGRNRPATRSVCGVRAVFP